MKAASVCLSLVVAGWMVVAASVSPALAGPAFFAGELKDGAFIPNKDAKGPCFSVRYSTITADVADGLARVKIVEAIQGPTEPVQAVCVIPLPPGAEEKDCRVTMGPPGQPAAAIDARFHAAPAAAKLYQSLATASGSVSVASWMNHPAMVAGAVKLEGRQEVTIEYTQPVANLGGVCRLDCPLPAVRLAREARVSRLSVTVNLRDRLPLRSVFSPSHELDVQRKDASSAVARASIDDWTGGDDFRLLYVADAEPLGLRVLAYRESGEDEGYFLLVGNPTGGGAEEKALEKDILFVLDTSGSMRGEKIEQARAAIDHCLGKLNPGDRFNVVTFGTKVTSFKDRLVPRSDENVKAAREFIDGVIANGLTNIGDALAEALRGEQAAGRPRIVIFLTDGSPTAGQLVPEEILKALPKQNTSGARIFVMGLGHDVNAHLLDKLAQATDGASEYIAPEEAIDVKVASLYTRLSHPVLANVTLDVGKLKTNSVYPAKLPAIFKNTEIMVAGRYRGAGRHTFTLRGDLAGAERRFAVTVDLPDKPQSEQDFVAGLWAARKIGYLLQEIRLNAGQPQNKELVDEIVRLSRKFGIITEYTQFLAYGALKDDKEAADMAGRRLAEAGGQKAGQWAVNQARNDQMLQGKIVAGPAANVFYDRQGRVQSAQTVMQVGARALYYRDGQWQDSTEPGDRKKRTVKLFSDEYFELMKNSPDFARAQQAGWNVSVNVGSERIEVEKDGKTKEDAGKGPQPPAQTDNQAPVQQAPHQDQQMLNQAPRQIKAPQVEKGK